MNVGGGGLSLRTYCEKYMSFSEASVTAGFVQTRNIQITMFICFFFQQIENFPVNG